MTKTIFYPLFIMTWTFQVALGIMFFIGAKSIGRNLGKKWNKLLPAQFWPILVWVCGVILLLVSVLEINWLPTSGLY
jgi:hypothetical protein